MAVNTFIPEIWSARLLRHLDKTHVVANLVNRDYEGEIKAYGDKVRINQLTHLNIKSYRENNKIEEPDALETTHIILDINQQKYFNFFLDDVDAAQVRNNGGLMDSAMKSVAYKMNDEIEMDILKEMDRDSGVESQTVATKALDATNVFGEILKMKTTMDKNNVPMTGRKLIVKPEVHAFLIDSGKMTGTGGTMAEEITRNGHVGQILGFDVYLSNNIGASGLSKIKLAVAFVSEAITFAEQITEMEAYRPEMRFADAVKGLTVYGTKVTQPKAIVCLKDNGDS